MPDPTPVGRRPDFDRVAALDRARTRGVAPDHGRSLAVARALLAEAVALGVWPPPDAPGRLDHKLRVARAFNVRVAPR